jgi:hypothetical protein
MAGGGERRSVWRVSSRRRSRCSSRCPVASIRVRKSCRRPTPGRMTATPSPSRLSARHVTRTPFSSVARVKRRARTLTALRSRARPPSPRAHRLHRVHRAQAARMPARPRMGPTRAPRPTLGLDRTFGEDTRIVAHLPSSRHVRPSKCAFATLRRPRTNSVVGLRPAPVLRPAQARFPPPYLEARGALDE